MPVLTASMTVLTFIRHHLLHQLGGPMSMKAPQPTALSGMFAEEEKRSLPYLGLQEQIIPQH